MFFFSVPVTNLSINCEDFLFTHPLPNNILVLLIILMFALTGLSRPLKMGFLSLASCSKVSSSLCLQRFFKYVDFFLLI